MSGIIISNRLLVEKEPAKVPRVVFVTMSSKVPVHDEERANVLQSAYECILGGSLTKLWLPILIGAMGKVISNHGMPELGTYRRSPLTNH